jgi:hypothetical protein
MSIGFILLLVLMAATALVLIIGIGVMIKGGETNQKYGNKMMTMRVALQGAALAMLGVLYLLSQSS